MTRPGELAPDFTLTDQEGRAVTLSEHRGKRNVILFFYPKDETPVCTKESCRFRDEYARVREADAEVYGISADSDASHAAFAQNHRLPFPLLSDPGRKVHKLYGATTGFGLLPSRVSLVIDKSGRVAHRTVNQFSADAHVDGALDALVRLRGSEV
jgi:peroxiredoxin Q/BCP